MTSHQKRIARASRQRRVNRFKAQGLTTLGKPYRRHPNLPRSQRAAHYRRLNLLNFRRRQARLAARLNSRGQPYARADFTAALRLRLLLSGSTLLHQLARR